MQILKAGALYVAVVFGAGFVLGPIRLLWAVPRFGTWLAELMEMPVMLVVIVIAARWTVAQAPFACHRRRAPARPEAARAVRTAGAHDGRARSSCAGGCSSDTGWPSLAAAAGLGVLGLAVGRRRPALGR